jgi:hypothetical protein
MRQVDGQFVACERPHVVSDDDALGECFVDGHAEPAS